MTVRNCPTCVGLAMAAGLMLCVGGCKKGDEPAAARVPAPEVTIAGAVERKITDYKIFQGRTEPIEEVEIHARVSGYLLKADFTPGSEVQKGMRLFEIDPRPCLADSNRAEGETCRRFPKRGAGCGCGTYIRGRNA